jgi:hypothetical protein
MNDCLEKVLGGTGILPVRRTGWKTCATQGSGCKRPPEIS